jgi:hypothetical protein
MTVRDDGKKKRIRDLVIVITNESRNLLRGIGENHENLPIKVAGILPNAKPSRFRVAILVRQLQEKWLKIPWWYGIPF